MLSKNNNPLEWDPCKYCREKKCDTCWVHIESQKILEEISKLQQRGLLFCDLEEKR